MYDVWESLSISVRYSYTNSSSFCKLLMGQNLHFSSSRELRMGRDYSKSVQVERIVFLFMKSIEGTNLSCFIVLVYEYSIWKN